ncbi:MAG: hypothetical protein JKY30_02820 [Flavobacteriales bacterium]|nr:hypothetical protein [Flavobacteriales bacterium]
MKYLHKKILKRNLLLVPVIIFFLMQGCTSSKKIGISIEQNGKLIRPLKGTVTLDKKEFNILVNFPSPMGLLVNASFNDKVLKLASEGRGLATLSQFKDFSVIAEEMLNPEKMIYVSNEGSNYWFYESGEENKFNRAEVKSGNYKCTRIIKNFYDLDAALNMEVINVNTPIYLVFLEKNGAENIKMKRTYLKIKWKK